MPSGTYKALKSRGQLRATRACKGRPAEVEYESLPQKYKEAVVAEYGNPYEYVKTNAIQLVFTHPDCIKVVTQAHDFCRKWRSANKKTLPAEQKKQLPEKVKWLEVCLAIREGLYSLPHELIKTLKADKYAALRAIMDKKGIKLPGSYDRLMDTVRAYYNNGTRDFETLITGKLENTNSAKLDDAQLALLKQLHGRQANHYYEKTCADFNRVALQKGWKLKNGNPLQITVNTVASYVQQFDKQLSAQRKGTRAWRNKHDLVIRRERPSRPLFLTVHDGWDYERYYQQATLNSKGHRVVNYYNRKNVVMVADAYNDYILGYAIGNVETAALIKKALKNAVDHIKELTGQYALPWQIKADRFAHAELKPYYASIAANADFVTLSKVANARDKVIEPSFARFNTKYVQESENNINWSGRNITAKEQANPEYLEAVKQYFPDEQGVIAQIHDDIARARADKQAAWLQAYNETPADDKRVISREQYLELFGVQTERSLKLTNKSLNPTINGVEHWFVSLAQEFTDLAGLQFTLKYDPDNMSDILAIQPEMRVQFVVPAGKKPPMALKDMKEGDRANLNKYLTFKDETVEKIIDANALEMELVAEMLDAETVLKLFPSVKGGNKHLLQQAEKQYKQISGGLYGSKYNDMEEGGEI